MIDKSKYSDNEILETKIRVSRGTPLKRGSSPSKGAPKLLGGSWSPGPWDVICARGLKAWNHEGNRRLRSMIDVQNSAYGGAETKMQRTAVVSEIVETIRANGVGFVKQEDDGEWYEVGDRLAREKVGQLLRESLGGRYRSSATAKKRRRETIAKWDNDYVTHSNEEVSQILSNTTESIQSKSLSDDAVLKLFNETNCNILDALKRDILLVQSFQAAMPKDSDGDEDEDDDDDAIVWVTGDEAPSPTKKEFV